MSGLQKKYLYLNGCLCPVGDIFSFCAAFSLGLAPFPLISLVTVSKTSLILADLFYALYGEVGMAT